MKSLQPIRRHVPLSVLFANATHTRPRLSPNGSYISYLASANSIYNIWVRHIGTGALRQVTFEHTSVKEYHWLPDGSGFVFSIDYDGDENDKLYRHDFTTGSCHAISAAKGVKAEILCVDYHHPEAILLTSNARNRSSFDVYRYSLAYETLTCVAENPGDVVDWVADRNLVVRVAKSLTESGGTLLQLIDEDEYSDLLIGTHDDILEPIEFTADGDLLLLSSVNAPTAQLVRFNIYADDSEVLFEHPTRDIVDLCTALNGTHVEFVATQLACTEWHSLNHESARHVAALNEQLIGDWRVISRDINDETWLIRRESDDAAISYYLYQPFDCSIRLLFHEQAHLEEYELAQTMPISFATRDRLTLHGFFTPPSINLRKKDEIAPLVIMVHEGPWERDHWGWKPEVQWLANRGYSVLQVNFRGSAGFGKALLHAGDREWGGKMHLDILDAKAWAVSQGLAQADRCGIYGFSYGGFEVLTALSQSPDEFRCGIAICAPSNLCTLIESIPTYSAPTRAMLRTRIGDIYTERAFLTERSPLTHVENITAPLFLVHGLHDPRVPVYEAEQIIAKMHEMQKPVEFMLFPDEGHGLTRPENRIEFYEAAEIFLELHLAQKEILVGVDDSTHNE